MSRLPRDAETVPGLACYEQNGVSINPTSGYDCAGWLETVRVNAAPIRIRVEQATESARREGVFPGVMRDLRTKFRLNWRRARTISDRLQ